jgi:1-acyl-sn-glycerol-3-phosphate acyltransferase
MSTSNRSDHEAIPPPSQAVLKAFGLYLRWYLRRHFHAVRIANAAALTRHPGPLIVYVNHASWWDPLTCMLLARAMFPAHRHHGPMDGDALARYPLLRKLGLFPVERGTTRGAAQFMNASMEIMRAESSLLWLTPQGAFSDVRQRPVVFKPGLAGILKRCPDATAIPLAIEYTFWDERLPEVLINVGEPQRLDPATSTSDVQQTLAAKLTSAQDSLSALAQLRDPNSFENLLSGSAGVGLAYDTARRLSSWMRGKKYQAEHTLTAQPRFADPAVSGLAGETQSPTQGGLDRP